MFVDKLTLKNFRKYKDFEVEFKNRLSVIVGQNGSGKTTILDAVSCLLSLNMKSIFPDDFYNIEDSDIRLEATWLNGILDYQKIVPASIAITGNYKNQHYSASQSFDETLYGNYNSLGAEFKALLQSDNSSTILPVVCKYGAGRLWTSDGINDLTQTTSVRQNGYINCLNAHLDSKSMNTWFEKMTYVELQKNTKLSALQAVYSAIKKSFAEITECRDIRLETNLINHELEISYTDSNDNSHKFVMSQLSDGYRCTVSLIADIAYRMATLNPQLGDRVIEETEGIVLIDEVDLHLHPEWQQKILGVLTKVFPEVQFIVTTHAPAVINSANSENLIILEDDIAREPFGEVYGKDVNTIISGIMGASERPESVKKMFEDFYRAIDENDFHKASEILAVIEKEIGNDDTELAGCRVKLDLLSFTRNMNN